MKVYYYAHTGHRIGLDRFRRASAVIKLLEQSGIEVTLLSSDYRIASVAREYGIKRSVGVDVVRNIANIAYQGDKIIFDSEEANPLMLEDMRAYFSTFIHVNDNPEYKRAKNEYLITPYGEDDEYTCNAIVVDEKFYEQKEKTTPLSFFFGDDDYEKDLEKLLDSVQKLQVALGLGFYYFLDYEEMLKKEFKEYFEFEEYQEMVQTSKTVITASTQTVLETLASGGKVVYFQREDYPDYYKNLFETLQIPMVDIHNTQQVQEILSNISTVKYKKIENYSNKLQKFITNALNL